MKRVAHATEDPVVVPVVVVAVDVHVRLVVPPIERGELYMIPSVPPLLDSPSSTDDYRRNSGLYLIWHLIPKIN
ncbi:MAG TPA: hypothetical protein VJB98_01475 [Candidatus Paceibacterota bacterium]